MKQSFQPKELESKKTFKDKIKMKVLRISNKKVKSMILVIKKKGVKKFPKKV